MSINENSTVISAHNFYNTGHNYYNLGHNFYHAAHKLREASNITYSNSLCDTKEAPVWKLFQEGLELMKLGQENIKSGQEIMLSLGYLEQLSHFSLIDNYCPGLIGLASDSIDNTDIEAL